MKGIILAAGRGSRMGEATSDNPKCLLKINGKTLLESHIRNFHDTGIKDVAIVTGYKRHMIKSEGFVEFFNPNWKETQIFSSLLMADPWLSKHDCIVTYGDIFFSKELLFSMKFADVDADICVAYDPNWLDLWSKRFLDPLEDAETFKINHNGLITEIGGRAKEVLSIEGQYMGLLKLTPKGWSNLKKVVLVLSQETVSRMDMTSVLSLVIKDGGEVRGVSNNHPWGEVDTISDLQIYQT
jgi:choline kinase